MKDILWIIWHARLSIQLLSGFDVCSSESFFSKKMTRSEKHNCINDQWKIVDNWNWRNFVKEDRKLKTSHLYFTPVVSLISLRFTLFHALNRVNRHMIVFFLFF